MGTDPRDQVAVFVPKGEPKMDIADQLQIIGNSHTRLVERYHALGTTIARLTAAGCVDAREHWKDGKYLYLLSRMKDGVRRKKYIGNHPLRIAEARQKLQNYQDRISAILTQEKVSGELAEIEALVSQLLTVCSRSDLAARFALQEGEVGDKEFSARCGSASDVYLETF